ncbi:MAG: isoleucine--tRNA ligase [Oscillospiraceae bacterium]|nr:isoleucine--tRNA ligase [Oscillospiraceae bacterium]
MYQKVPAGMGFPQWEAETLAFWKENHIFEKSMAEGEGKTPYIFYDGPPTANGTPHIGHVLTRVVKDTVPRFQTMKGRNVPRKAGWDTHGLPVELEVEKQLGLDGKEQIEAYGLAPFIDKCKESVWKYKGMWEEFSDIVGFWADMDHPYVTYDNSYIESIWWSLRQIHDRGLLYKGFKIVPYCPRCGTPLSSHEVAQGYKDVKERSAYVKFPVADEPDTYILAWTTTPWTLPSNLALCVGPGITYVKVRVGGGVPDAPHPPATYYLAKDLLQSVLGEDAEYEILEEMPGTALEYKKYTPLFDFVQGEDRDKSFFVTVDNYVTTADGTGVVHMAPAFGEDDARISRKYKLPFVQFVDPAGNMTKETAWHGTFCKDADPKIIAALKEKGLLLSAPNYTHSYPHCWRCDTPLLYYARDSWFIEMTAVKDDLIRNNKTINWVPEFMGEKRFGDWLENVQDWSLSRDRYWGTPLNIWLCACGHRHSVGSIAELKEMSDNCPDDIELHRPYIDAVTIRCAECEGEMHRTPEVIDCWYDSGAMPFAQHHYPFENKELFESQFPADFISEAVDQTRGWFYSLLAISTLIFDKAPFKNVIVMGHVQDKDGQKMSKSKGNAVEPMTALREYGADAIRWYFLTHGAPWIPNKFHGQAVVETQRKFLSTLWNTYAFYVLYAEIYQFDPTKFELKPETLSVMDRWILSRLNHTVKAVDENMSAYKLPEGCRPLADFVDDLSNWYVRRSRERFWADDLEQDKINAYLTLYTCLTTVAKAAAPMIPFMTESIYQNLVRSVQFDAPESVHLCSFPEVQAAFLNSGLETSMAAVLQIVTMGRAARNGASLKIRQPLSKMYVKTDAGLDEQFISIIADELNIKAIELTDDVSGFVSYTFKPQLKTLGPKYGKQIGEIRTALAALDGIATKAELDEAGSITLDLPGGSVTLTEGDLLIETAQREGLYTLTEHGVTVAIDTTLDDALIEEGFIREVISKIQTMRKEANFEVTDRIAVTMTGSDRVAEVVARNFDEIAGEVLARTMEVAAPDGFVKEWDVNGEAVVFGVKVV